MATAFGLPAVALRRVWRARPMRLRHQMLAVLAAVALVSGLGLYGWTLQRVDQLAESAARQRAQQLVLLASAALAAADDVHLRQAAPSVLAGLAAAPGVRLAQLVAADGRELQRVSGAVVAPARSGADRDGLVVAAAPVGAGLQLRIEVASDGELGPLARVRDEAFAAMLLVITLTMASVYAFLHRAFAPLRQLTRFARRLVRSRGERLAVRGASYELQSVAQALNDASSLLHRHLQDLHRHEERTAAILNATPDALLGFDAQGRVTVANPAVTSVFGVAPEQAVGLPLEQLLVGIDIAEAERRTSQGLFMRSSGTRIARFELNARRHDGTEFPAEVSLSRVDTDDGARYACVVRDVTEQRMTFSMLNLYSRALECTSNGVVISDMSLPGKPVFYANPAFYRITGYDPGDAIGRNCAFLQRDDVAQPEIDTLRQAMRRGESAKVVLRNYRKDGTLFFNELAIAPVSGMDGGVAHYVGILNDVTERERARLAIAERSARLNAVFDLSPDGFVVFDRDGRLVYTNRAFDTMSGLALDPAAGEITIEEFDRRFAALCEPGAAGTPLAQSLAEGRGDRPETLQLQRPERRVLARVVRGQDAAHGESILFFRDITRETEVDRMKSEFLTTAAHELRTPMVSVYGFTELLLNRPVPEGRRRDVLETIHRQASLLINMVNELLDLARIEARQGKDLHRERLPLGPLLERVVAAMNGQDQARPVRLELHHGKAQLFVDGEKFHRALGNVLSNAYKYSPQGGDVTLETLDGRIDGQPAVGVRVRDQGIGMTPAQAARVFERFFRADPSGNIPGTGLGMSLVKEIVELHGGRVGIDSEPGKGTAVTLWFPLSSEESTAEAAA